MENIFYVHTYYVFNGTECWATKGMNEEQLQAANAKRDVVLQEWIE